MFSVDRDKLFICVPTYRLIILVSTVLINKPMRSELLMLPNYQLTQKVFFFCL